MAYFAEIDDDKIVTRVVVIGDEYDNEDGCDWCEQFFGSGTWVRTVLDGSIRKSMQVRATVMTQSTMFL